jgi:hypothetical protein
MTLEDLLKKYVSEESPETEAKTEAEDGPQEQGHSHSKIEEEGGEREAEGEINGKPAVKRKRKKAEDEVVKGK